MVNDKYKIAFIVQSLSLGGAQRVITTLANNFTGKYQITIITFFKVEPFYELNKNIKILYCYDSYRPSSGPIEALQMNFSLFRTINSIVKKNHIDILIGFMTTPNILATWVGKANKIPVIISERTNPYHQSLPKIWKVFRFIFYRYSDMLIVQSETIKKYFDGKIRESKIRILPNPISIELTNKRETNNFSAKKNIVLSVGRLTKSKAHDMLIKAFAQTNYRNWELWIAGDGPEQINLQELVNELNITDNVKLLGLVKDISAMYNVSKIFAFSSTYEGFPNALIEAMHFGLACVSTDCPTGPSELIIDGENGYLAPVNDIGEFHLKLSLLMESKLKIGNFGKRSILSVQRFEERKVVTQWENIINNLIKKPRLR